MPKYIITPPIAPITIESIGLGINGSAVIDTKPANAPFNIIIISVFPPKILVMTAPAIQPPQAANCVFIKILDIAVASSKDPKANCDPPLKPYQPIHKMNVPKVTNGIDEAAKGAIFWGLPSSVNLPRRGPNIITPARAAAPPQA